MRGCFLYNKNMKIILASKSERRISMLRKKGYKFRSVGADVSEKTHFKQTAKIVKDLAFKKAFVVSLKYPNHLIIGADTLVVCDGKVLGKPKDEKDALRILKFLNGKWQSVYTGIAIINKSNNKILLGYEMSKCRARKLSEEQLKRFASKHLDKAGAYAVQDTKDPFIEKIIGNKDNIVGMPMSLFNKMMKGFD